VNRTRRVAVAAVALCVAAAVTAGNASAGGQHWGLGRALTIVRPGKPKPTPTPNPTPSPTPAVSATPTPSGPTLVHTYTFTGTSLDPDWGVYNSAYGGNPDARVPALITVSGGALHVTTSGRQGSGLCLCKGSGKPTTPYGRWDVRARASADADHGFAMLLWPNAENWPLGGEIDMAEFPGALRAVLQTTVHYGATNRQYTTFTGGDFTAWHTYSVIWTPASITYLLDDKAVMTVTDPAAIPTAAMHLGLQAGANSGTPSDTSATLDVAWVKIYR
jgi:licheninase